MRSTRPIVAQYILSRLDKLPLPQGDPSTYEGEPLWPLAEIGEWIIEKSQFSGQAEGTGRISGGSLPIDRLVRAAPDPRIRPDASR